MSIARYQSVLNDFAPTSFSSIIDRFFNDSDGHSGGSVYSFVPRVDIIENEKAFELQLAVPGLNKEDFRIDVKDNHLTISGERKLAKDAEKNFRVMGTQYGAFSRAFTLPENTDVEKIQARYNNGILEVTIPKDEKKMIKTTIEVA